MNEKEEVGEVLNECGKKKAVPSQLACLLLTYSLEDGRRMRRRPRPTAHSILSFFFLAKKKKRPTQLSYLFPFFRFWPLFNFLLLICGSLGEVAKYTLRRPIKCRKHILTEVID